MTTRMHKTLENTRFRGAPVVSIAARVGAGAVGDAVDAGKDCIGMDTLVTVSAAVVLPWRHTVCSYVCVCGWVRSSMNE